MCERILLRNIYNVMISTYHNIAVLLYNIFIINESKLLLFSRDKLLTDLCTH